MSTCWWHMELPTDTCCLFYRTFWTLRQLCIFLALVCIWLSNWFFFLVTMFGHHAPLRICPFIHPIAHCTFFIVTAIWPSATFAFLFCIVTIFVSLCIWLANRFYSYVQSSPCICSSGGRKAGKQIHWHWNKEAKDFWVGQALSAKCQADNGATGEPWYVSEQSRRRTEGKGDVKVRVKSEASRGVW